MKDKTSLFDITSQFYSEQIEKKLPKPGTCVIIPQSVKVRRGETPNSFSNEIMLPENSSVWVIGERYPDSFWVRVLTSAGMGWIIDSAFVSCEVIDEKS